MNSRRIVNQTALRSRTRQSSGSAATHPKSGDFGYRTRRGITLLEILVSIFILVIGLLGTAALIPIGNSEVLKGGIAHRGAEVGIRGYHEFRVRRMNDPRNWLLGGQPCTETTGGATGGGNHQLKDSVRNKALCLDPLAAATGAQSFPYQTQGRLPMPVLSLRKSPFTNDPGSASADRMDTPFAKEIFTSRDNLTFDRPEDTLKPAQQFRDGQSNDPRRRTETLYSWLATLVPQESDPETYLASFAVFFRNSPTYGRPQVRDELVTSAQWIGGTDFRISSPQGDEGRKLMREMLRTGRWLLLGGENQKYIWYRVTAIEGQASDESSTRQVTLEGPDWVQSWGNSPMVAMYGGGGVVAVYERTVQLEWDTMWSKGTRQVDERPFD